jgi:hypothetical protein
VASCGVNAAVRRAPEYRAVARCMSIAVPRIRVEHSATAEVPAAQEPGLAPKSLTRFRALERAWARDLPVFAGEPGPDATTEQGQGNHGEGERREPDGHVMHSVGAPQIWVQSVRCARKQTAIDAIVVGRVLEPDVLNPISPTSTLGGRVLPTVFRAVVP